MKLKLQINQKNIINTKKVRRFLNFCKKIDWTTNPTVYLKVSYGRFLDNFGKMTTFQNDGDYTTQKEFNVALAAFLEEEYKITFRPTPPFINSKKLLTHETLEKKPS